jgi:hypothetical protein
MNSAPRVVEAGLRSFVCAYERYQEVPFRLGGMVAVREGTATVLGVVADAVSGPEDPARPLQVRGGPGETAAEVLAGEPGITLLLRTRVTVVSCGHIEGDLARAALPPNPPPLLALVEKATLDETIRLAREGAFLALLVASPLCDDAVIAAAIRSAAAAFAEDAGAFRIAAGKELARLLRAEPARLTSILREVAP